MTSLVLENLTVELGGRQVLDGVSLTARPGECVGLIGPNGAGKSTLMRAALGLVPSKGTSSLARLSPNERSRVAAWLPQGREIAWDLEVRFLVQLGRIPHRRLGHALSAQDHEAVSLAMHMADVAQFATRRVAELSGGEQARALLARALAQEAPLLFADEPVAALDPGHQIALMEIFKRLTSEGHTVITALHDLGLAARWCSRLVLLDRGRIVADGPPEEVLEPQRLRSIYGIEVFLDSAEGGLVVQPLRRVTG
ncbi:ABC transporter ATP-binding protein [Rhodobacteraceae bacterium NNCM2]|nr:ABC transporter ATP-binding protein [Coraliihabitans acroporae]